MKDFEFIPRINWALKAGHITLEQYNSILIEIDFVYNVQNYRAGEKRMLKRWTELKLEDLYNK